MGVESLALFIPILALSIPIVAIIANAFTKKYKYSGNPAQLEHIARLEERVKELENVVANMTGDVARLEDKQNFISKLLDDK